MGACIRRRGGPYLVDQSSLWPPCRSPRQANAQDISNALIANGAPIARRTQTTRLSRAASNVFEGMT